MAAKKQKHSGSSSSSSYDTSRFVSYEASDRYQNAIARRGLVPERGIGQLGNYGLDVDRNISIRNWETFTAQPEAAVVPIVREFYANALEHREFLVFVRGKWVSFDAPAINRIYGLTHSDDSEYSRFIASTVDYEEMIRRIAHAAARWRKNEETVVSFPTRFLDQQHKTWFSFICANMIPTTHLSDVTVDRAGLLYAIVTGMTINVGTFIRDSVMQTINPSTTGGFGHPSLICALCRQAGVVWSPDEELQRPNSLLDHRVVSRFRVFGEVVDPPQPPRRSSVSASTSSDGPSASAASGIDILSLNSSMTHMTKEIQGIRQDVNNIRDVVQNLVHWHDRMDAYMERIEGYLQYNFLAPPDPPTYPPTNMAVDEELHMDTHIKEEPPL